MFTGIVAAVGRIVEVSARDLGIRIGIEAGDLGLDDVAIGDSIAIQGACMTVVSLGPGRFEVDLSAESLARTTGLDRPAAVNLEKALRVGDRLGGHLVSGHVDGLGEVLALDPAGDSRRFDLRVPRALGRYLATKGSVTVDGVSLTVNEVSDGDAGTRFCVNLIPHTLAVTTLGARRAGDRVNIEVDLIARHVERLLGASATPSSGAGAGAAT
jgi:riboflavin synthase